MVLKGELPRALERVAAYVATPEVRMVLSMCVGLSLPSSHLHHHCVTCHGQGSKSALAVNLLGRLRHDAREFKEAGDLYTQALALSPNDSAIFQVTACGRGLLGMGVERVWVSRPCHAMATHPTFCVRSTPPPLLQNLGGAFASQGEHQLAFASFQRAIDLDPRDRFTYFKLGMMYEQLGTYQHQDQAWVGWLNRGVCVSTCPLSRPLSPTPPTTTNHQRPASSRRRPSTRSSASSSTATVRPPLSVSCLVSRWLLARLDFVRSSRIRTPLTDNQ